MKTVVWIRAEREQRGLSQANLARLLGISQPKLSQWETEKAVPSEQDEAKIRQVLADFDASVKSNELPAMIRPRSKRRIAAASNGVQRNSQRDRQPTNEGRAARLQRVAECARQQVLPLGPKAIALFAGCGGMSLGFKQAGYRVSGFVELDEGARLIYEQNFPATPCLGHDIREVSEEEVAAWRKAFGDIDVVYGGPPCQGFSLTGKRDKYDPRNELYSHFARVVGLLKPSVVVLENVRLLTSMKAPDSSNVLDRIYEAFTEAGYACDHRVVNAQDYGVPQFRERVILIGVRNRVPISFPEPTHGLVANRSLFGDVKPYVTFRDACGDLKSLESAEKSATDDLHFAVDHPEHVLRWLRNVPEGESAHNNDDPTLRPPCGYNTTYKRIRWDEPCSTISTTFGMISGSRNVHPTNTRSLTIREAARCQTFPDDFIFTGNWGTIRTAIGNALPPRLAEVIARHIRTTLLDGVTPLATVREATC